MALRSRSSLAVEPVLDSLADSVVKGADIPQLEGQSLAEDSGEAVTQVSMLVVAAALVDSTLLECCSYRVF